jgi:hypothetical protein
VDQELYPSVPFVFYKSHNNKTLTILLLYFIDRLLIWGPTKHIPNKVVAEYSAHSELSSHNRNRAAHMSIACYRNDHLNLVGICYKIHNHILFAKYNDFDVLIYIKNLPFQACCHLLRSEGTRWLHGIMTTATMLTTRSRTSTWHWTVARHVI